MKYLILFIVSFAAPSLYAQDTITVGSLTAGYSKTILTEDTISSNEYSESVYTTSDGGEGMLFTLSLPNNERKRKVIVPVVQLEVYPNPGDGIYKVELLNAKTQRVEILSVMGELIQYFDLDPITETTVDISIFSKGMYFLKVTCTDGSIKTKKIVYR